MTDILFLMGADGGDFVFQNNDFATAEGLENVVTLALFGGNYSQDTDKNSEQSATDASWWGNKVPGVEVYNSTFERVMKGNVINDDSLAELENAAKTDLQFLATVADVSVSVTSPVRGRGELKITIKQKGKPEENKLYLFDTNKLLSYA